jgi:sugar phosphate isomerase/epimerase
MKIAFHTNAFVWAGITDLNEIAEFAIKNDYSALEIGPGFHLDEETFRTVQSKIEISNFIYARNFIDDNPEVAQKESNELFTRMKFASLLNVKNFVFSTGISRRLSVPESGGMDPMASMQPVLAFLNEALELAEKLDLNLLLENCPMYRNIATSPLMWHELFNRVDSPRLGLCYDPSHFVWQMIDVYQPIAEFADKIKHIHLKDTAVNKQLISRIGILHNVGKERGYFPNQWWRHTIIGGGDIDWQKFSHELNSIQYQGNLSFEMEDHEYELDPQKVSQGLYLQRKFLKDNWCI